MKKTVYVKISRGVLPSLYFRVGHEKPTFGVIDGGGFSLESQSLETSVKKMIKLLIKDYDGVDGMDFVIGDSPCEGLKSIKDQEKAVWRKLEKRYGITKYGETEKKVLIGLIEKYSVGR
jgi:hypothetical protein